MMSNLDVFTFCSRQKLAGSLISPPVSSTTSIFVCCRQKMLNEDAEALRFLLEDENVSGTLQTYKWNRLPFGLTCSRVMLRTVLKKHFESYEGELA
ncbi:hypothetical protein OUZ56_023914 [Daphnia magna]|uniref:Uncharacterized protein n=1 Tax=Daphnia magna TaxID=35525 RepID=A0ABR0AZT4_9CRUS|nr:hypothetical protein OUZ56_023914 [Daphnia magna]